MEGQYPFQGTVQVLTTMRCLNIEIPEGAGEKNQVLCSFAPLKHKFFGWLAIQDRCWTSDRLVRWGLPNLGICPLCELANESINHLLLQCPYARGVWFRVLWQQGLHRLTPSPHDVLRDLWPAAIATVVTKSHKDFNSLCILIMHAVWLECNARIFDNARCSLSTLVSRIKDEWASWVAYRSRSTRVNLRR
jgi:hypothetical protein